jgi:hypothetical protein
MEAKSQARPYWHVDIKWVFGILFTLCLFISLTTFTLATLTSEKTAVPLATYFVASQFSRDGLDDPREIEEFKNKTAPGAEVYYPLEGREVKITRQELETLTPRELRLRIFEQVVTPLYSQVRTDQTLSEIGFLAFLNFETHNLLNRIFLITLVPLVLTGAGLVYFSYRYGRLISPAVPLLLTSTLPSLLFLLIQNFPSPQGDSGPLSALPRELLLSTVASVAPIYYACFGLGLALLVTALIVKIFSRK